MVCPYLVSTKQLHYGRMLKITLYEGLVTSFLKNFKAE
ncbi:MAG: hypothetical protein JETT_0747 [Candidatus Jettenia ecosi]|uniref:Uncharacterized protein n=1 Tax=Candidatus Jettenia ecosi TaxID=2494326 RepID=A0A533QEF1_9BACT|nr:MAG: hypothetical protein JETT_0747 [Candidatus Jettenia ecosi]